MRKYLLVAIATMILGLGTLYTTAKASSFTVFDLSSVSISDMFAKAQPPSQSMLIIDQPKTVPVTPPDDDFNKLVREKEAEVKAREVNCLADNIYFEARGESKAGKIAVGEVTINRVKAGTFGDSICGVVHQHEHEWHRQPTGCQFSWYCDTLHKKIHEQEIYDAVVKLAEDLYDHYYIAMSYPDITNGALYFHTRAVDIGPCPWKKVTARIDDHVFYYTVAKL
jgi:spore germination cell wall hydrolase CwlJ-like protein